MHDPAARGPRSAWENAIQCVEAITSLFGTLALFLEGTFTDVAPINNVISWGAACPGQLRPNRQELQFSEFIETRFASYMQSIPSGDYHMHLFTQSYKVCTTVLQEVQML